MVSLLEILFVFLVWKILLQLCRSSRTMVKGGLGIGLRSKSRWCFRIWDLVISKERNTIGCIWTTGFCRFSESKYLIEQLSNWRTSRLYRKAFSSVFQMLGMLLYLVFLISIGLYKGTEQEFLWSLSFAEIIGWNFPLVLEFRSKRGVWWMLLCFLGSFVGGYGRLVLLHCTSMEKSLPSMLT